MKTAALWYGALYCSECGRALRLDCKQQDFPMLGMFCENAACSEFMRSQVSPVGYNRFGVYYLIDLYCIPQRAGNGARRVARDVGNT